MEESASVYGYQLVTVAALAWNGDVLLESSSGVWVLGGDSGVVWTSSLFAVFASFAHWSITVLNLAEAETGRSQIASHAQLFDQEEGWVSQHMMQLEPYLLEDTEVFVGFVEHGVMEGLESGFGLT